MKSAVLMLCSDAFCSSSVPYISADASFAEAILKLHRQISSHARRRAAEFFNHYTLL